MPSQVSVRVGFFDRFAGWAASVASRAPFFFFCVLLVIVWLTQGAATIAAKHSFHAFLDDKYQLEINTTTTIITFLMVALLQNSQTREDQATQHKLNAIADGLADLMEHISSQSPDDSLANDIRELKDAVGLVAGWVMVLGLAFPVRGLDCEIVEAGPQDPFGSHYRWHTRKAAQPAFCVRPAGNALAVAGLLRAAPGQS